MHCKRIGELEDYEHNNICLSHDKCIECPLSVYLGNDYERCFILLRQLVQYKSELLIGVPDESDKQ